MSGPGKSAGRAGDLPTPAIDCFRGQHLNLAERQIETESGRANVTVDQAESPLAWLARRRDHIEAGRSAMRVGHVDFFAYPIATR